MFYIKWRHQRVAKGGHCNTKCMLPISNVTEVAMINTVNMLMINTGVC